MNVIDCVIPWLNPTDSWFSQYKCYSNGEHPCRIRDLNTIIPTINGIIRHVPSLRHIYIIVFDEEQIPSNWSYDTNIVRIVYHRDIIPSYFLPNFNSLITSAYIYNIPGISDYILFADDDMIYNKDIPLDYYLRDNKIVHEHKTVTYFSPSKLTNTWDYILNSTADFVQSITGQRMLADTFHMPVMITKNVLAWLMSSRQSHILKLFDNSKVRMKHNVSMIQVTYALEELMGTCLYYDKSTIKHKPIWLNDNTTFDDINNAVINNHIVCLNDSENLTDEHSVRLKNIIEDIYSK